MSRWLPLVPLVPLVVLVSCGGGGDEGPQLVVTTSFTLTDSGGIGPSPLDPLLNQPLTIELVMDEIELGHASSTGCRSTYFSKTQPPRTASGPVAATLQTEVLDRLIDWTVELELCETAAQSNIQIDSVIDPLNLNIGCLTVPAGAMVRAGLDPVLTTFTATRCGATLLDVVFNRVLDARDFSVTFATGPARLP
ncbi:MAG: hypothetical protein M3680_00735 [Myxococcota bacterium]|nr:hypothetical protein [Myxococcota bacterium]